MRLGIVSALILAAVGLASSLASPSRVTAPQVLACGQIRCQSNADCPTNCGPCVAWSGTCALFGPR